MQGFAKPFSYYSPDRTKAILHFGDIILRDVTALR